MEFPKKSQPKKCHRCHGHLQKHHMLTPCLRSPKGSTSDCPRSEASAASQVRVDLGISPFSSELMFGAPENMEKHIKTIYSPSETMKN